MVEALSATLEAPPTSVAAGVEMVEEEETWEEVWVEEEWRVEV